jgi:hypothetical protein
MYLLAGLLSSLVAIILPTSDQTGFDIKSDDYQGLVTAPEYDGYVGVIDTSKMTDKQEYDLMIAGNLPFSNRFIESYLQNQNSELKRAQKSPKSILKVKSKHRNKNTDEPTKFSTLVSDDWVIPIQYNGGPVPSLPQQPEKAGKIRFGQNQVREYNRHPVELEVMHAKGKQSDGLPKMKSTGNSRAKSIQKTRERMAKTGIKGLNFSNEI